MSDHPTTTLTPGELEIVEMIATRRAADSRARGWTNQQRGPQPPADIERVGVAGELAFAKIQNIYPDLFTLEPRNGQPDFERFGQTIEVKATRVRNGLLIAPKKTAADCYALIIASDWPTFRLIGFARADELLVPARLTDFHNGKPPAYTMRQCELKATQLRLWEP
jgi:hypothetical protein